MLFSPLLLGSQTLPNRICMPPMDTFSAKDGFINDFHLLHYTSRAFARTGLIIIESCAVNEAGRITDGCLGIWSDAHIKGLEKLVKQCSKYGSKLALQLNHSGRKNSSSNARVIGPSSLAFSPEYAPIHELKIDEIKQIKADFIAAAKRAQKAGFKAVQVHAAHGYLLNSFLDSSSNIRTDEYGGSFTNRTRLLCEIISKIKALGLDVYVRVSATQWEDGAWDMAQTLRLASMMDDLGVSLFDVSAGGNAAQPSLMPPLRPLYQCEYAKEVTQALKEANSSMKVSCVGLITTAAQGQALLLGGVADLISYGRAHLRNPNLALAFAHELGHLELLKSPFDRAFCV